MKAYQINQDLAEANVDLGWACFYKGDWDEAFKYYKRALELEPANPEVNYYVAVFFKDIGLYRKAIEFYSRAIEIDPTYAEYKDVCAQCYMKIGEFKRATELLKEALEFEPNNTILRLFYARKLIMMKKYDEAEEEIDLIEKLDSNRLNIQYTRAYIFAAKGEKEKGRGIIDIDFTLKNCCVREVADPIEQPDPQDTIDAVGHAIIDYHLINTGEGGTLTNQTGTLTLSLRHPRRCEWDD